MRDEEVLRRQLASMVVSYDRTKARTVEYMEFLYLPDAYEEVRELFKDCDVVMAYLQEHFDTLLDNPSRYLSMVKTMEAAYQRLQELSIVGRKP
jgi:hypothetical protein